MGNSIGQHNYEAKEKVIALLEIDAKKQRESIVEGPIFDFAQPSVVDAEEKLRKQALSFKQNLEPFHPFQIKSADYAYLLKQINAHLPALYKAYDVYVSAVLSSGDSQVTCQKGCSHCCSHYVTSLEPFELLFIHEHIRQLPEYSGIIVSLHQRMMIYKEQLDKSSIPKASEEAEDLALYRYFLKNISCPFLEGNGQCGIYDQRPFSCRMFYSYSSPKLCKGKAVTSPKNRNFILELPDDIEENISLAAGWLRDLNFPEGLFSGLLHVNELFGQFDTSTGSAHRLAQ